MPGRPVPWPCEPYIRRSRAGMSPPWSRCVPFSSSDRTAPLGTASWRGQVRRRAKKRPRGASYRRALELDPNSVHTRLYYAQFLGHNGEPNEALQILEPLWQSGRSHDLVGIAIVNALGNRKDFARCLQILEEALKSNPRNAYLWQQTGACRMQTQGPAAAIEPMSRAVELYPERGPFQGGLAHLLETTGAFEEAEKHFRQLLEIEPQNPVVYYWLADFLRKHRPSLQEEAVQVAQQALSLPPAGHLPREEIEKLIQEIREAAPSPTPQ